MSIILSSIQQSLALVCSQARLWLNYESNFFYVRKCEPDLPTRHSYLYSLWDQVGVVMSITVFFLYLSLLITEPGTCGGNRQIKHWHSWLSIDIWEEGIQSSNILKSRRTFEHTGSDFQNSTITTSSWFSVFRFSKFYNLQLLPAFQYCDILPHQGSLGTESMYGDIEFLPYQSSQASDDGHASRLQPEVSFIPPNASAPSR